MKLAICTPSRGSVEAGYAKCLANLTGELSRTGVEFEVCMSLGSVVSQLRIDLATIALEKNFDWILWLDSDMHFPHNVFSRMIAHNEPIVAASYSTRYKPQRSVAFINKHNYDKRLEHQHGLHKVWAVGMGCMLTHRSVFESIPEPWFNHQWDNSSKSFLGEDIYFCNSAGEHGFSIYVDADLSQEVGHYGTKIFLLQETRDYQI